MGKLSFLLLTHCVLPVFNGVRYNVSRVYLKCLSRRTFCGIINAADKDELIARKLSSVS